MWSQEEIQFLLDNPNMSLIDIARALDRTEGAVRAKRSRLKIRSGVAKSPWTADERRILQESFSTETRERLLKLLPGRTWDAINSQVSWLRKRQWRI